MMIPGENDGVKTVEDPECSDAATTRHGFSSSSGVVFCCLSVQNRNEDATQKCRERERELWFLFFC